MVKSVSYARDILSKAKNELLQKGIGRGIVIQANEPRTKHVRWASVGGPKVEREIASENHGDRIRSDIASRGYSDLTLYRGISRPGGRKKGIRVLPTALSHDVRYYTPSEEAARNIARLKSGRVTGEVRKYGVRVKNPLVIDSKSAEKDLWERVGEHIQGKYRNEGYKHTQYGIRSIRGGSIQARLRDIHENHPLKDPDTNLGVGVQWHSLWPGPIRNDSTMEASSKEFLGEYMRDKGHDAAVFLSRGNYGNRYREDIDTDYVPSDGMSQVVIPHSHQGKMLLTRRALMKAVGLLRKEAISWQTK